MIFLKSLLFGVIFFGGLAFISGLIEFLASLYYLSLAVLIVIIGTLLWYAVKPERGR